MDSSQMTILQRLKAVWSSTAFSSGELSTYAMPRIVEDSRRGVDTMSFTALAFLSVAALLCAIFNSGNRYVYSYGVLAFLSLHIHLSASRVIQLRALYLLAMALLIISGSALVLVAQQAGKINMMTLLSVTVLFMLVPLVPWGLREAMVSSGAIYLMFTASTFMRRSRFTSEELWILQFLMLTAALISMIVVSRALMLRKHDMVSRFELQLAHNRMQELSNRDPLTGAWNRRYLEAEFSRIVARHHVAGQECHFALFDVDRFKQINDTYGHRQGDLVLIAVQQAFASLLRPGECLVRIGGDEYGVLSSQATPPERLEEAARLIYTQLQTGPDAAPVNPTFSLGWITLQPGSTLGLDQVYKCADDALYAAKRAGGNRCMRYTMPPQTADMFVTAKAGR